MTRLAIPALTLATFAIGTTEFAVQGLLPEIAAELGASVPRTGLLITGYALGVTLGGPVLALLAQGLERRATLLGLMAIFIAGNALCALAPDYPSLMAARIVTSFCHGSFFGIGSVVAAGIVPADRRARAVAMMWSGIAAANVLGIPAGTALGQMSDWRLTFWAVALVGGAAMMAMALWLPRVGRSTASGVAGELGELARPQVLMALSLTVFLCGATFCVFTFIAPLLAATASIAPGSLPVYLVLFGIGGVVGMQLGGRMADRNLAAAIFGGFVALTGVFLVMSWALRSPLLAAAAMVVWGFAFYFPAAGIQVRVVDAARGAPNLASTLVQSGFNLGNAIGPSIGAAALSAGIGYAALPLIAAAMTAVAAGIALHSAVPGNAAGTAGFFSRMPAATPDSDPEQPSVRIRPT
ncbi:MAG TPA: MFS transporter [Amaricoccus sp.]|uniref:MFS transporter n=1 Tax=Amaricoccus sp. TaxID=1872485 RepID=UPI002CC61522|nr:MFS transporter [Amaricoccus sp.]HMQ92833.1 MFS transporter [Amaricoccus sp.]HMR52855.1 MFS transporter [Amaricoccus sp.]HMR60381.1 MFS transporter [Amaricoccus sp.]HMT99790.1 MFS transporter [Amaricoccus sp.]